MIPTRSDVDGSAHVPKRQSPRTVLSIALVHMRRFARDTRGGASIELALGALVLVSTSAMGFDLYSRIEADTAIARMVVTMADFVSRDTAPDGDELRALGNYLYKHELGVPADLVYVVTALRQPPGDPRPAVVVLWSDDTIRIGEPAATAAIAADCARFVGDDDAAVLPEDFRAMSLGEVLVVVEVCARLTREGSLTGKLIAGDLYRLHALPARDADGTPPAAPVYAARPATYASGITGAHPRGALAAPRPRTSSLAEDASA